MWEIIVGYLFLTLAVLIVAAIVPGIRLRNYKSAFGVAAVYALLNYLLFKVLIFITFPLVILKVLTFGIFGVVLNAALLMLTDKLLDDVEIEGFGSALLGALGISFFTLILNAIF